MVDGIDLFGEFIQKEEDKKYTTKVSIPQYLPSAVCPSIYELYDIRKYQELMNHINNSNVSDEDKTFLKLAATRHIVFNYAKIADYYAHAGAELQKLMEESALVIIDIDDAIANGYVKLSKNIEDIMNRTGIPVGENKNQFSNRNK